MTTLSRSRRMPDGDFSDASKVYGRIMCKRLFVGEDSNLLTVVVVTLDGEVIELKTWSKTQARIIDGKFNENDTVVVDCPVDSRKQPNAKFSDATFETYKWTLDPIQIDDDCFSEFVQPYTDIDAFHRSATPTKMLAGLYVDYEEGPLKYDSEEKVLTRGYYYILKDENHLFFKALIWEPASSDYKLDSPDFGDYILLPFAREQDEKHRSEETIRFYTVTTTYPPVKGSLCVDPDVVEEFCDTWDDDYHMHYCTSEYTDLPFMLTRYNPYNAQGFTRGNGQGYLYGRRDDPFDYLIRTK